jgi:DNA polymerase-3 subunit gamma/tau
LISIKADGGLRDALSMFDLNVTFSVDNSLRHKDVLENLHILDSDYYFTLTDHLVAQNHTETLLLVDEIMRKGFDGHQFISGLMEHFRNLLFAKDPKTLALMELSDESRNKFAVQSEKTQTSFLLSAMSICSQCEIHYKSAKNPRLHLELSLLKINYLPSLFKPNNPVATEGASGKKSESPVGTTGTETNETLIQTVLTTSVAVKEEIAPVAKTAADLQPEPKIEIITDFEKAAPDLIPDSEDIDLSNSLPEQSVASPVNAPTLDPAVIKSSISTSGLRSAKNILDSKNETSEKDLHSDHDPDQEVKEITLEELQSEWTQIANNFKTANLINKYVMMNRPIQVIENSIHISFENEVQMQQFSENIKLELLTNLRTKLKNHLIDIELDLVEQEKSEKKMLYTQSDKYNFLVEKHPVISELKQRFGLDHEF